MRSLSRGNPRPFPSRKRRDPARIGAVARNKTCVVAVCRSIPVAEFADADNNRDALMTLRYLKLTRRLVGAIGVRELPLLRGGIACLNPNIMTS
jgi:hypothetical protein